MKLAQRTAAAVAPYLTWMALMAVLPHTAWSYAARSAVAGATLIVCTAMFATKRPSTFTQSARALAWGIPVGLAVLFLWVWPERFDWYRRFCVIGTGAMPASHTAASPYDPAICGWPLALARLVGSAFVIAPAEEMFFRSFLYRRLQRRDWTQVAQGAFDASAFVWTVALFALEHDRLIAGALAGAAYGALAVRRGLGSAIAAHVTTNLALGLYVIHTGAWQFW